MKHLFILAFIIILNNMYVNSQNYVFSHNSKIKALDINLDFYADSTFMISSYYKEPDTDYATISPFFIGSFSVSKNSYILKDTLTRSEIKLSRCEINGSENLVVEKGFGWMKNKIFYLISKDVDKPRFLENYLPNQCEILFTENEIKNAKPKYNKLLHGLYLFNDDFKIIIGKDNTYVLYRYNFEFSKGSWSRNGNYLWLFDTIIKSKYKMYINNDESLTSFFIPGDFLMRNFKYDKIEGDVPLDASLLHPKGVWDK